MNKHSRLLAIAISALVFTSASPAHAGGQGGQQGCSNGQVLTSRYGTVQCTDPTPGVNVAECPAGTVLSGIKRGVAICVAGEVIGSPVTINTGTNYTAPSDGFLFVAVSSGGPNTRAGIASVVIDGKELTKVMSQDSYVTGVPSIAVNNLTYPVHNGQTLNVTIANPVAGITVQFIPLFSNPGHY